MTPAAKFGGGTLQYTGDGFTVDADEAVNITAIDVNGKAPDLFTVNENISLGAVGDVAGGGAAFPVSISNTFTLTLTGTAGLGIADKTYTGLGDITLNGANAGLTINVPAGLITLAGDIGGNGILTVSTATNFTGSLGRIAGTQHTLASVIFNADSNVTGVIWADTVVQIGAVNVNANDTIDAVSVQFIGDGTLTVDAGISNGTKVAVVTNTAPNQGTLIITNGNIGNVGNAPGGGAGPGLLKQVTFSSGAGPFTAGDIFATNITVGKDGGNVGSVVQTGAITGAINFTADGQLTATGAITGNVAVSAGGTLAANNTINGAVTFGAGGGTLTAGGTMTGDVTASNAGVVARRSGCCR